jgi:RAB protein geranylgeranyltransferase component A
MVSSVHSVCAKGYYIAIVSTNVETNQPEKEIEAGLELVGSTLQKFIKVAPFYSRSAKFMSPTTVSTTDSSSPRVSMPRATSKVSPRMYSISTKQSPGRT